MWEENIAVDGSYDFERALRRLAFEPLFSIDLKELSIKVPLWIHGEPFIAEVKSTGTVDVPQFTVTSNHPQKETVMQKVTKIFKWDASLSKVYSHLSNTDLKPLCEVFYGTPLVCEFNLYRSLMKSIIHQQLNLNFANILTERFVKTFGFQKDGVWFYPSPEKVTKLQYEDLQALQFSRRKAEYVIDTSKMMANGKLSLDDLYEKSNEAVIKTLVKIRGIGPWTAESLLLFGMGREDLLPVADVGLQNAVQKLHDLRKKPSPEEMRKLGKAWSPYRSYASLYLWESLGNHTVSAT